MAGVPYADMPCSMAVTDAAWEHIDPTPNIHELFLTYDRLFFSGPCPTRHT